MMLIDWILGRPQKPTQYDLILKEIRHMSAELEAFKVAFAAFKAEVVELLASANKALARIQELLGQIGNSTDPAEIAALTVDLQAETAKLDGIQQALEAASAPPTP